MHFSPPGVHPTLPKATQLCLRLLPGGAELAACWRLRASAQHWGDGLFSLAWFSSPQLWSERSWKIGMLIVVGILASRYFLWWSYLGSHVQVKFSRMATSVANCRWGRSHSSLGVGILRPCKSARTGEGTTVKLWWLRLMVQKSTHHQLRLVVYPMISTVFDTSQVVQGFIYPWKTKNGPQ